MFYKIIYIFYMKYVIAYNTIHKNMNINNLYRTIF